MIDLGDKQKSPTVHFSDRFSNFINNNFLKMGKSSYFDVNRSENNKFHIGREKNKDLFSLSPAKWFTFVCPFNYLLN